MNTGTSYRSAALDQIEAARRTLARHATWAATGRCGCGDGTPCPDVLAAQTTLAWHGALPRRQPGAALPAYRAPEPNGFDWFTTRG